MENLTSHDLGDYQLIASNSAGSVTSSVINVQFDVDRDGLGDTWEQTYFTNLTAQTGLQDFDLDGVSNHEEFEEGTNPRDGNSLKPRLRVEAVGGIVTIQPLRENYAFGETVTLTAIPDNGSAFLGWSGFVQAFFGAPISLTNPLTLTMNRSFNLRALFGVPLPVALDATNLVWRTAGHVGWFGQTNTAFDGLHAAQSGPITHNQITWMETTVTNVNPTMLSFRWRVSSDANDKLAFTINGSEVKSIAGHWDGTGIGWLTVSQFLPAGVVTLRWTYSKDGSDGGYGRVYNDAAWVDQVSFSPVSTNSLPYAADVPNAQWHTHGSTEWFAQTNVTHDGVDAVQSGAIGENGYTVLSMTVEGPAVLNFWWRVSSEAGYDRLSFRANGSTRTSISGEIDWQQIVEYLPPGRVLIEWIYAKDVVDSAGLDAGWLDEVVITPVAILTLADATDSPGTSWQAIGNANWFGQTNISHDGIDAAQSGLIAHNQSTVLSMTNVLAEPSELSFWWKVSSESQYDWLSFRVNGVEWRRISGEVDWHQLILEFPPGTNFLEWVYSKDVVDWAGADAGWVDEVRLTAKQPPSYPLLAEAIDLPNVTPLTGGNGVWFTQTNVAHDGVDAVQSGAIGHGQSTVVSVAKYCIEPSVLAFWWKVSSEAVYDRLSLRINGLQWASISGAVDWQLLTVPLAAGENVIQWMYAKDSSGVGGADAGWVDQVQISMTPLAEAADAQNLNWSTVGNAPWFGQTNVSHDGIDAVQSGSIGHSQATTLRMTNVVDEPSGLSFWWKVSSETNYDRLLVRVNGVDRQSISGEVGWQETTVGLAPGSNLVEWIYSRDGSVTRGSNAGWVDQVSVSTTPLTAATDSSTANFQTAGSGAWFGQTNIAHDGIDAAQSGPNGHSQSTVLRMTNMLAEPSMLSFWWKVSSETQFDRLSVRIDGIESQSISGEADWRAVTIALGAGSSVIEWAYEKDDSTSAGFDAGWVDEVSIVPTRPLGFVGNPTLANGQLTLRVQGLDTNCNNYLEASTNLIHWETLTRIDATSSSNMLVIPISSLDPWRFYRLICSSRKELWVSAFLGGSVGRFDAQTGQFLGIAASLGGSDWPQNSRIGPDGNLYLATAVGDNVHKYNSATGQFLSEVFPSGTAGLGNAIGFTFASNGDLYVGSWENRRVLRFNTSGDYLGDAVPQAGEGALEEGPTDLEFGPDGNLYVAGYSPIIKRYSTNGVFLGDFISAANRGVVALRAIDFGPDGTIYGADNVSGAIHKFDGESGAHLGVIIPRGHGGLENPMALECGSDGILYVSDYTETGGIRRYNATTGAFIDLLIPHGTGGLGFFSWCIEVKR